MQQTALDQNILFDQNCNVFTNILFCNRKYTEYTHVAGTPGDEKLVQELYDTWVDQELDHVEKSTHEVKKSNNIGMKTCNITGASPSLLTVLKGVRIKFVKSFQDIFLC